MRIVFACVGALRPSQHFFSHVGRFPVLIPVFNQYSIEVKKVRSLNLRF